MTDIAKLNKAIKSSGLKMNFIADKLGISYQCLQNKMSNKSEFRASEIKALSALLSLTVGDIAEIFLDM